MCLHYKSVLEKNYVRLHISVRPNLPTTLQLSHAPPLPCGQSGLLPQVGRCGLHSVFILSLWEHGSTVDSRDAPD